MMQFDHWYLPDGEKHLPEWMAKVNKRVDGRLTYQYHKYEAAMRYVPAGKRRLAVDIGAHVGLWSYFMARDFAKLIAFEPMDAHADCWGVNMQARKNAVLHRVALGERCGPVMLRTRTPGSSGDTGVEPLANGKDGGQVAEQRRLDDYDLANVDFIKVDCEGYEFFVLRGAAETIHRCKPIMVVEQKAETGGAWRYRIDEHSGVEFLFSIGMKSLCAPISGDWIMGW